MFILLYSKALVVMLIALVMIYPCCYIYLNNDNHRHLRACTSYYSHRHLLRCQSCGSFRHIQLHLNLFVFMDTFYPVIRIFTTLIFCHVNLIATTGTCFHVNLIVIVGTCCRVNLIVIITFIVIIRTCYDVISQ